MLELVERGFFKLDPIKLSDPAAGPGTQNPDVQVLRVGKFNHPKYGEFEITPLVLQEMKENYDNKIRGVDIAFDYFHDSDKEASGWPTELYLSDNGNSLWAKVDWTPLARKKLAEREIRYFSPDFAFKWQDPETGVTYKNVLFGGGLTNRPFVKDMAAIVAAEEEIDQMTLVELEKKILKLAEDGAGLAAAHEKLKSDHAALLQQHGVLQKKLDEMPAAAPKAADKPDAIATPVESDGEDDADDSDDPKELKEQIAGLKKQLADMSASKQMSEKAASFNVLLSEGKACAAQKESYMKGDMEAFVKLSQPLNMNGKGHTGSGDKAKDELNGDEAKDADKVLKLAEEKVKADPKLKLVDAISIAHKELRKSAV